MMSDASTAAPLEVVAIGCGLAGLSLTLSCLRRSNPVREVHCCCYDRDDGIKGKRGGGYGLTLTYNPKGPLETLGVLEELALIDSPSRSHYLFNSQGEVLGYYGNTFRKDRKLLPQRGNLRIARGEVRRVLYEKICGLGGEDRVKWGHELGGIERGADGKFTIEFVNGVRVDSVDLVVGADGVNSKSLRLYITSPYYPKNIPAPPSHPTPLNILLVIGVSTLQHRLLEERAFHTVDGKRRLFLMPFSKGETMWQFTEALPHEEGLALRRDGTDALLRHVVEATKFWHHPIPQLITTTEKETVWGTALVDRQPMPVCHKGGRNDIVFIGDAAHAMSPFKGAGANQALLDGVELAENLFKKRLAPSVLNFERIMIQRSRVIDSRRAAAELHSEEVLDECKHSFSGLKESDWNKLRSQLEVRGVSASEKIDDNICHVIQQLEIKVGRIDVGEDRSAFTVSESKKMEIIEAVKEGDLAACRKLSLQDSRILGVTTDENCNLAALAKGCGHERMYDWFVNDVGIQ